MLISIKAVLLQHLFVWVLFVAVFGRGLEERRGSFVPSLFFLCRIESGTGKLVHTHSVCCQRREKGGDHQGIGKNGGRRQKKVLERERSGRAGAGLAAYPENFSKEYTSRSLCAIYRT